MLQPGDLLPDVPLVATDGRTIRTRELTGHEPLVLVFFRGSW